MRAVVKVAAGLTVTERDRDGLRLEKYRPFHPPGLPQERDLDPEGTPEYRTGVRRASVSRCGRCPI